MTTTDQRRLGASGIVVPAMGIGTLPWGDKRFGYGKKYSRDDVFAAYRACMDAGLNYFDTSENYGHGMSEQLIGEFHRADKRPIVVSTKFSPANIFEPSTRFSPKAVARTLDESLERLGLETVDLIQMHTNPPAKKLFGYMDALAETVKAGKARAVGVCNFTAPAMRRAHARLAEHGLPLAANQVGYNLLHRYPETNGVLQACRELDVALIAYLPLAEGILTGKYRLPSVEIPFIVRVLHRIGQQDFDKQKGEKLTLRKRLAKPHALRREVIEPMFVAMEEIAVAREKTIPQVALNWLLTSDPLVIPIPGAKNPRQAAENAGALGWELTLEERERISAAELAARSYA